VQQRDAFCQTVGKMLTAPSEALLGLIAVAALAGWLQKLLCGER
jgi:hypothetical protein